MKVKTGIKSRRLSDSTMLCAIASVGVYPGADDGETCAYESGKGITTRLHWDDGSHQFSHSGAQPWTNSDAAVVDVIKPASGR